MCAEGERWRKRGRKEREKESERGRKRERERERESERVGVRERGREDWERGLRDDWERFRIGQDRIPFPISPILSWIRTSGWILYSPLSVHQLTLGLSGAQCQTGKPMSRTQYPQCILNLLMLSFIQFLPLSLISLYFSLFLSISLYSSLFLSLLLFTSFSQTFPVPKKSDTDDRTWI